MKYPIGIQSFDQTRNESYVYVDKIRMNKIPLAFPDKTIIFETEWETCVFCKWKEIWVHTSIEEIASSVTL